MRSPLAALLPWVLLLCVATAHADESYGFKAWQITEADDSANASVTLDTSAWETEAVPFLPAPTSGEVWWIRQTLDPSPGERQFLLSSLPRDLQVWIDGELAHSEERGELRKPRLLRVSVPPGATVIAIRIEDDPRFWEKRQVLLGSDLPRAIGTPGILDEVERAYVSARQLDLLPSRIAVVLLGTTALLAGFVFQQRRALSAFGWFAVWSVMGASWFGIPSAIEAGWLPYRWQSVLDPAIADLAVCAGAIYTARLAGRSLQWWMRVGIGIDLALVAARLLIGPDSIHLVPVTIDQVLLVVIILGAAANVVPAARAGNRPAIAIMVGVFAAAGSMAVFFTSHWVNQPLPGALHLANAAVVLSMAVAMVFLLVDHARDLDLARAAAMRFVPQSFLDNLGHTSLPDVRRGDAVERQMTVLFSDIRNFTGISEGLGPREVFGLVNDYLAYVAPEIGRNNGFIDKYIGDAIMALFDTPKHAVQAALACQDALARYNAAHPTRPDLNVGIGLHTGTLILGTVGSEGRLSCTVIGDTVNVASRLEGLTKRYGVSLLLSAETAVGLENTDVRSIDTVNVDGREKPVEVFSLRSAPRIPSPRSDDPGMGAGPG